VNRPLTREEVQTYQERWRIVNQRQREELRQTTADQKIRQLDTLMRSVDVMGWRAKLAEDDWYEHELWNELRKKMNG
jgi:hypothetical protein